MRAHKNIMAAMISQLRTGHCGLNYYLHRFGKKNPPYCECGNGKETVEHYLLECRRYNEQRKTLRKEVRTGRLTIEKLLGQPQTIKHTMEYIKATGRLEPQEEKRNMDGTRDTNQEDDEKMRN